MDDSKNTTATINNEKYYYHYYYKTSIKVAIAPSWLYKDDNFKYSSTYTAVDEDCLGYSGQNEER